MKHYVLNDQESRRTSVDVHVQERPLREIYLKPFEIAVKEAKPWAVMAAYNKAAGEHLCQNRRLLTDLLRDEIGFDGAVISDWSAVKDKVMSHKNGLDLQMPGPSGQMQVMLDAVQSGELSEEELNQRVRHVLELVEKVTGHKKTVKIDWNAHHENAVRLAEEGAVLLKDEDHILPLKKGSTAAVLGYLTLYCTDTLGISPTTVGTILLLSKLFDGVTDIFCGWLVDNTHTKLGRGTDL